MTQETETVTEPQAATLKELKQVLPKAESNFLIDCLEKEMTVEAAKSAWMANLEEQVKIRDSELEEVKSKQVEAEKKTPGVDAIGEDKESGANAFDNPGSEFRSEVDKLVSSGMDRQRANSKTKKANPELHAAWLEDANSK